MSSPQEVDFIQLQEGGRTSDRVINSYLDILQKRGKLKAWPTVFTCNTHFMVKLLRDNNEETSRWVRGEDIFKYDLILVPYFVQDLRHWVLFIIDFRLKEILIYDSLQGEYQSTARKLLEFLRFLALKRKNQALITRKWKIRDKIGPRQYNSHDCGVFLCVTAESYTADRTISYTQRDIPWLRGILAEELRKRKIISHQKPPPEIEGVKPPPMKRGRKNIIRRTSPMFVDVNEQIHKKEIHPQEVKDHKKEIKPPVTTKRTSEKRYRSSSSSSSSSDSSNTNSSSSSSRSSSSSTQGSSEDVSAIYKKLETDNRKPDSSGPQPPPSKETQKEAKTADSDDIPPGQAKTETTVRSCQEELDNIIQDLLDNEGVVSLGAGPNDLPEGEVGNDWEILDIHEDDKLSIIEQELPPTPGKSIEEPVKEQVATINLVEVTPQVVAKAIHPSQEETPDTGKRVVTFGKDTPSIMVRIPLEKLTKVSSQSASKGVKRQGRKRKYRDRASGTKYWKAE